MTLSKVKKRRLINARRGFFDGKPWSIMPSSLESLQSAMSVNDIDAIEAALQSEVPTPTPTSGGVAIIPVTGVLRQQTDFFVKMGWGTSYAGLSQAFAKAISDPQIKAILFYMDSPGGSAIGCKQVADEIYAARGTKPVVAFTNSICGSACYYMAAAMDRIESTADAYVGSIGTIYVHFEQSGWLEDLGIGANVITNTDSPKKGSGNSYSPLTAESKANLQEWIDSYGSSFINDVARFRNTSAANVKESYGQGDAFRGDVAISRGMVDAIVRNFQETLSKLQNEISQPTLAASVSVPAVPEFVVPPIKGFEMKVSMRIRGQLLALGLIAAIDASDEICLASMQAFFTGRGEEVPKDESEILKGLRSEKQSVPAAVAQPVVQATALPVAVEVAANVQQAKDREVAEARLADLRAAAKLINVGCSSPKVTDSMVLDAAEQRLDVQSAVKNWNTVLSNDEPAVPVHRVNVSGQGADRFAQDAVDAIAFRSLGGDASTLSSGARDLVRHPLWAIAGRCLEASGEKIDMYGDRELIAESAMQMGVPGRRDVFYSGKEDPRYIAASAGPAARPGDFPNILSGLANKMLDTIELDEDYSFPEISAVLPSGLRDFKPAMMINKGIVEELDEVRDADHFTELGLQEEVLSYLFLRRFGNKWGWTPVMLANDDLGAFVEGMIGLAQAWMVTQNRLVLDRLTSSETLLDGSALYANRADTGNGTIAAANNNLRSSGGAPSDTEWGAMLTLYAGIGGINTGRRVRGTLNTILVPTNSVHHEAMRTFESYGAIGETKTAATTSNVGLWRGKIKVVPESELNGVSATAYYGFRSPQMLNSASVVRAYFNGFGSAGRRERWYDPSNKTTWVSLEGRIAVAVKNWRYTVKNAGA